MTDSQAETITGFSLESPEVSRVSRTLVDDRWRKKAPPHAPALIAGRRPGALLSLSGLQFRVSQG